MRLTTQFPGFRSVMSRQNRVGAGNHRGGSAIERHVGARRLWPMLAMLLVGAGCTTPADPLGGVRALVVVSRPIFKIADTTTIQVTISNNGTDPVSVDVGCGSFFEVFDGTGQVAPGYVSCPTVFVPPHTLAAGATYTESYVWRGQRDYSTGATVYLPAGLYSVRAAIPVNEKYVIRSETVPLQILSGLFN